jgi:hypothetical protein
VLRIDGRRHEVVHGVEARVVGTHVGARGVRVRAKVAAAYGSPISTERSMAVASVTGARMPTPVR